MRPGNQIHVARSTNCARIVAKEEVSTRMNRHIGLSLLQGRSGRSQRSLAVTAGSCSGSRCTIYLQGALLAPLDGELRRSVRALLRRGERLVVLDLAGVQRIDAAGVGELARVYDMAVAAQGALGIAHATAWVREVLHRAGLFEILTDGGAGYRITAKAV